MNKPLLSIITINRNDKVGLKKTMESVFNLSFKDFEYIIIDGNSTDESVGIIESFLKIPEYADKISYWVSEKDNGIYNAMNKGITHANGKWVSMMNAGDTFLPDALDDFKKLAVNNPNAILYGVTKRVLNDIFVDVICTNANKLATTGICHQAVFVPLELHKKHGLYNEKYRICADYDFLLKCFLAKEKFVFMDNIICTFDMSGISQSKNRLKEKKMIQKAMGVYPSFSAKSFLKPLKFLIPYGLILLKEKLFN